MDGYWSVDDLIVGTDEDLSLWFAGDFDDDMVPLGMSENVTGYPILVGYKWVGADLLGDGIARKIGFVLTPISAP